MGRFRPPGPVLLLLLSSMLLESGALASHPLTAHLVAAQGPAPADPPAPGVSPTAVSPPSVDALEADMLARLNAERAAAGVGPLQDQAWAHSIARQHSDEMAGARDIWHNMAGYMDQGHRLLGATLLGENVSMDRTLEANDARLFASPEHHQNIVDPQFNFVGIGIARDVNDWIYVTEDFSAVPHGANQALLRPATPAAAPAPAVPASAPAPAQPAAQPAPPRAPARPAAQPAPAPAQAAAAPAPAPAPAPAGVLTALTPPDLVAASPPALALPVPPPAQGAAVPAPVEAPAAPQVPSAPAALAAPALPTAAPPGDAAPSRGAAPGASQPFPRWVSLAPERARRLLPAAGVALFLGALLFSRRVPAPVWPPPLGHRAVAGSGNQPLRFRGRSSRPWIPELPRGPPAVAGVASCFA